MKPGEAFNCSKDVNSELSKAKLRLLPNGNIALEQINSLPLCEKSKKHWICLKICNIECDLFCWAVADLHSNILDACRPLPSESKFFQFHAVFFGKIVRWQAPSPPSRGEILDQPLLCSTFLFKFEFRPVSIYIPWQGWVQDFPVGGGVNPLGGGTNIQISPKTA